MNPSTILDTVDQIIADIEKGVTPYPRHVHKLKTWARAERERLESKRLSASQVHRMAKGKRGTQGIAI